MSSIYNRSHHLKTIKTRLGEDFWFRKDGVTSRKRMSDPHIVKMICDGNHPKAEQAVANLYRMMPLGYGNKDRKWPCDYAIVKPQSKSIIYIKEFPAGLATRPEMWQRRAIPLARAFVLNHIFMVKSILPSYSCEDSFDSLLIDINIMIAGIKPNMYNLPPERILEIVQPAYAGCQRLGLSPLVMLSGGRGFWLQLFWDEPISRDLTESLFSAVLEKGGFIAPHDGENYWTLEIDDLFYRVGAGNLSPQVCRMPWSMKEGCDNVSVHLDLETGLPRPDYMWGQLPISSASAIDAAVLPSSC